MSVQQRGSEVNFDAEQITRKELRAMAEEHVALAGLGRIGAAGTARLVLDRLIDFYQEQRQYGRPAQGQSYDGALPAVWPSLEQLAGATFCSTHTVRRALTLLAAHGLITRVKWVSRSRRTTDLIALTFAGRQVAASRPELVEEVERAGNEQNGQAHVAKMDTLIGRGEGRAPTVLDRPTSRARENELQEPETWLEAKVRRLYGVERLTPFQREEAAVWAELPLPCQKHALSKVDDRIDRIAAVPGYLRETFKIHVSHECDCDGVRSEAARRPPRTRAPAPASSWDDVASGTADLRPPPRKPAERYGTRSR
jgi:hypothetical protein